MPPVTLRPAVAEDEGAIHSISAHIWEGEDYVPARFRQWLEDEQGRFIVAATAGDVVGFGKLSRFGPGEWWLEGLRVHPEYRGQGIARRLHEHAVALADEIGSGRLRFSTAGENTPIHKLAADTGFRRIQEYAFAKNGPPLPDRDGAQFVPAHSDSVSSLQVWLETSSHLKRVEGLFEEGWRWRLLLPRLEALVATRRVFWWLDAGGECAGLVLISAQNKERLDIGYLDCSESNFPALAATLPALGAKQGANVMKMKTPIIPARLAALRDAEWTIDDDFTVTVYDRPLARPDTVA